jgi:hypothetical protein
VRFARLASPRPRPRMRRSSLGNMSTDACPRCPLHSLGPRLTAGPRRPCCAPSAPNMHLLKWSDRPAEELQAVASAGTRRCRRDIARALDAQRPPRGSGASAAKSTQTRWLLRPTRDRSPRGRFAHRPVHAAKPESRIATLRATRRSRTRLDIRAREMDVASDSPGRRMTRGGRCWRSVGLNYRISANIVFRGTRFGTPPASSRARC